MNDAIQGLARNLNRLLSALAIAIAGIAVLGYLIRQPILYELRPGLRGMSPLTAIGLVCSAVAVVASARRRETAAQVWAATTAIIAVLTLTAHAAAGADDLSPAIGSALFGVPASQVGQTSVATAASLLLLAFATAFRRKTPFAADVASGLSLVLSSTALLGYLYGAADLYALPMFNSMALNTASAIAFVAIAELLAEPELGWAGVISSREIGGGPTRRQLSFVPFPVLFGWLLLRAAQTGRIGISAAMALLVIITVVPLVVLILRDGRVLNSLGRIRREREEFQELASGELQRRLAEQAAQLEREGAERAAAEAAMYRAQRMEAVGQLTSGIAHDFNNLLMAMRGNLELAQRSASPAEERLHRYLGNAIAAADKGAKVTAQLLAFSRSQKLQVRPAEINAILRSARELIGSSLGPLINVTVGLDPAVGWALTDPDQLELAILNIAVNARDAMPDGGTLRIESRISPVNSGEGKEQAAHVSIRVIDNGAGMPEDIAARAIEPFFTTKERDKGTGLGLSQVYGFVRQCGGDLRIESALGAGTVVEILLPQAEEPSGALTGPTKQAALAANVEGGRQVLVVDDDLAVRQFIVGALTAAGFHVSDAADGEAALALLDSFKPAAAVIDFLMPGMNGAEVAREVRRRRPGLPIVFVSGYSDTVALNGIIGAVVLRKPFDISALDRALISVLN